MSAPPPALSVVVPLYNEAECVDALIEQIGAVLGGLGQPSEIVVVDDGSTDGSYDRLVAARAREPRLTVLRLARNYGQTAALAAGIEHARAPIIVSMDADLQNDPADLPALLAQLDAWDAATGWRVDRGAGDTWVRRLSSRVANRIRNAISDETIHDSGCTFRAFRRECLRDLVLYRGFHRFIPTLLRMRGFRVVEVPVGNRPRRFGRSKYGIMNRAFVAFADLLVVRWMKSRLLRYEVAEDLGGRGVNDR